MKNKHKYYDYKQIINYSNKPIQFIQSEKGYGRTIGKMKMTRKEYDVHYHCNKYYIIDYITDSGNKGHMEVKTSFYDKYIKKFTKAFKNATITSFMEETIND